MKKKREIRKITKFSPRIRSRHPSHNVLRKTKTSSPLGYFPFKSAIRFGSSTIVRDVDVEINTVEAISNSSSKARMKECFRRDSVRTAIAFLFTAGIAVRFDSNQRISYEDLPYPLIAKPINGSRGNGIFLIKDVSELRSFLTNKEPSHYLVEKYYNFSREYRLHISKNGCFYTNRKMVKNETPENERFVRNDKNCVWILETNPLFDKPSNWEEIENESIKALNAVGLDVGAVDVRTQSPKNTSDKYVDFIIVEINSAPSFGEGTTEKYLEELPKLLMDKFNNK